MVCGCVGKLIHGAVGLASAVAGYGLTDQATIDQRRSICRACPKAVPCRRQLSRYCRCAVCGCSLAAKTRLAAEHCPLDHWTTAPKRAPQPV